MDAFTGNEFIPGTPAYDRANNIYASSTYGIERNMSPMKILQPACIEDIQVIVKNATDQKIPIAIRTGGHQYSGASSTGPHGIQLDLKPTFRRPKIDLHIKIEEGKAYLYTSVSWMLKEVFDFLQDHRVFMPTGQCAEVCLGGHIQTGGYGMLARSFGLLGDWVRELTIVDHHGDILKVTKESNADLFFGLLGGSPGNLGVLTHVKIEVQQDINHQDSKGLWMGFHYRDNTYKALLDMLVKKGEDPNFARGYDLTINVISRESNLVHLYPGTEAELHKLLPDTIDNGADKIANLNKFKYAMIIVWAQWINIEGEPPLDQAFFDDIIKLSHSSFDIIKRSPDGYPMSHIAAMWLFNGSREFPYPYVKRTNSTASLTLSQDKWSEWFAGRVNEVVGTKDNGLWISAQMQVYGGTASMLHRGVGNGTSYCNRDATIGGTWDVFYQDTREAAEAWQAKNDEGQVQYYSKRDRRVLWGSWGDWDMKKVWPCYYDEDVYKRVQGIRKQYDPNGTFTANVFCVEAA
ncbi:FAD-binding protein [Microdochium nivale]|nr:FAD-binding protein [Microdochium nivale]